MHEIQNDGRAVNVLEKVRLIKSDTHSVAKLVQSVI